MIPIKTDSAWKGTSNCRTCGIRDMVLFADLNEDDFKMIHGPVDDMEFARGAALFQEGDSARGICGHARSRKQTIGWSISTSARRASG